MTTLLRTLLAVGAALALLSVGTAVAQYAGEEQVTDRESCEALGGSWDDAPPGGVDAGVAGRCCGGAVEMCKWFAPDGTPIDFGAPAPAPAPQPAPEPAPAPQPAPRPAPAPQPAPAVQVPPQYTG